MTIYLIEGENNIGISLNPDGVQYFIPGDANEDGVIDMSDVTKVERIILGLDEPTRGADCNQDGVIDMADVTCIERIILGIDPIPDPVPY